MQRQQRGMRIFSQDLFLSIAVHVFFPEIEAAEQQHTT
jgi:hypothetical protein